MKRVTAFAAVLLITMKLLIPSYAMETEPETVKPNETATVSYSESETVSYSEPETVNYNEPATVNFNQYILRAVMLTEDGGGYYTGKTPKAGLKHTAWEGMDMAVTVGNETVTVDTAQARPSFCSSATYMTLLKALSLWDTDSVISHDAWVNLKPYTVEGRAWAVQKDGVGCWGRANANGPGMAVLAAQLHAGCNTYLPPKDSRLSEDEYFSLWNNIESGDFLKLFWNQYIGAEGKVSESGHMVVFLHFEEFVNEKGNRDGMVYYWSSNGWGYNPDKGYGIAKARLSSIYRAVATHISDPSAFGNAANLMPDNVDSWLSALDGKHLASEKELLTAITGEPVSFHTK